MVFKTPSQVLPVSNLKIRWWGWMSMDLFRPERSLQKEGIELIAGVDEVGRGCLAGPVFAAAVILPKKCSLPNLNDSKKLSVAQREELNVQIWDQALAACIADVSVEEIDRINILQASLKAMRLALEGLGRRPEMVLVDGKFAVKISLPQKTLIDGDARSASIAAASIIAKVARDKFMAEQEAHYPGYSFSRHKGYGTAQHLEELRKNGPTPLHRHSFAPVRELTGLFK